MDSVPYIMRVPCKACGGERGEIKTRSGQDCVYCLDCKRWQYNAPKTETGREVRTVTTVHEAIKPKQRVRILLRANGRCELCGKSDRDSAIHVGHIISVKSAIASAMTDSQINDDENLVAMCDECNLGLGAEPMPLRFVLRVFMERLKFTRAAALEAQPCADKAYSNGAQGMSSVDRVEGMREEWRDDEAPFSVD